MTWRKSDKYQLMGDIEEGNVTLTITGVTSDDAGVYCCRVEIPGIFNDQKSEINMEIKEGEVPKLINNFIYLYREKLGDKRHSRHYKSHIQLSQTPE